MSDQVIGWLMMAPLIIVVLIGIAEDYRSFVITAVVVALALLAAFGARLVWA